MSNFAIKVENLGKCYQIGELENYYTLRDSLTYIVKYPFKLISNGGDIKKKSEIEYIWALKDINFEVKHGEIIGIIGRNGAGKSTLLKILSRITTPTEGRVKINGRVGSLLEVGTGFHPELTGRENIYLNGSILGMSRKEIERKFDEIVDFAEIEKFLDTPVKRYSSGMYVRLAFAVAAHMEPEILIIDEVLAVGDIAFQRKCMGKMGDVSKEGRTILFVSHNLAAIKSICHNGIYLNEGIIHSRGSIFDVSNKYEIEQFNNIKSNKNDKIDHVENIKLGLSINTVKAEVKFEKDIKNLEIIIKGKSICKIKKLGISLRIKTIDNLLVSHLWPGQLNSIINDLQGEWGCRFLCNDINKYLAGGDYILDIILLKPKEPNGELLVAENIIKIQIPSDDVYNCGSNFNLHDHGLVPLPMFFQLI